jgi:integrase
MARARASERVERARRRDRRGAEAETSPATSNPLAAYQAAFHEWEAVTGYSAWTIKHQRFALARFIAWADERGLGKPQAITRPILERYQRHVYHYRKANGAPLSVAAQLGLLLPLQAWFKWMTKQNHLLYNPAADLDLPVKPKALPQGLLSIERIESVINQADVATPEGIRARAIMETLYSSGIRCGSGRARRTGSSRSAIAPAPGSTSTCARSAPSLPPRGMTTRSSSTTTGAASSPDGSVIS